LSQCNYFGPRNFGVFASYYTETLLYSNFRSPLFSRTCQARKIREIKGTWKKRVLQYFSDMLMSLSFILLSKKGIRTVACKLLVFTTYVGPESSTAIKAAADHRT